MRKLRPPRPDPDLVRVAGVYLLSRAALLTVAAGALAIRHDLTFRELLSSWDAAWYLAIADDGYPRDVPVVDGKVAPNATAFFPLLPLAIRAVDHGTPLDGLGAATLLAIVGGLASACLLWALVRDLEGPEVAHRAAALLGFFPASFVFLLGYSEAVMLPCAIAALRALLRRRWLAAGLLSGVATLARPNAVALCAACAWAAFAAIRNRREWCSLVAPALSPIGGLAFMLYLWGRTGDPLVSLDTQNEGWGQRLDFGANTVDAARRMLDHPVDVNAVVSTLTVVFVVAALVLMLRWKPPAELWVYTAVVIAPVLASATISSRPRFTMTAFPMLVACARSARGATWSALLGGSAMLLGLLTLLTLTTMVATP